MSLSVSTIRPGYLVSLKSSISGNVSYAKVILDQGHTDENGTHISKWETERNIADIAEHEEAVKVRGRARHVIASVCARSEFGLLCPEDKLLDLKTAVIEARKLAEDFNATAKCTKIAIYAIGGRIAPDDAEAVRAIKSEIKDLMDTMSNGLKKLNVKQVRDAAAKAKSVGQMLSPQAQERVKVAVEAARAAARQIVKAGEEGAAEIDQATINAIANSRTAFLDIDMEDAIIAVQASDGRSVDFAPEVSQDLSQDTEQVEIVSQVPAPAAREVELMD